MQNKSNLKQMNLASKLALAAHPILNNSGQQAFMYVSHDAASIEPLSKKELINRIADVASQDIILSVDELTRALFDASHRKIHLIPDNYQFDLIANE